MTVERKVTIQMKKSHLEIFHSRGKSSTCRNMVRKATMMIAAKTQRGNVLNKGPRARSTTGYRRKEGGMGGGEK